MSTLADDALTQRRAALQRANNIRMKRVQEHHRIAKMPRTDGLQCVAGLLVLRPDWLTGARVFDVLQWPARMGPSAARKLLWHAEVSEARSVGALTARQVRVLCAELRRLPG